MTEHNSRPRGRRRPGGPPDPGRAGGGLRQRGPAAPRRRPRRHAERAARPRGPGSPTSWPPPGSPTRPSTATSRRRTRSWPRSSTTAPLRLRSYLEHQMEKASTPEAQVRRWVEGVLVAGRRRRGGGDDPGGDLERRQRRRRLDAGPAGRERAARRAAARSRSPRSAAPIPSSTPRSPRTRRSDSCRTSLAGHATVAGGDRPHRRLLPGRRSHPAREHRVGVASGRVHHHADRAARRRPIRSSRGSPAPRRGRRRRPRGSSRSRPRRRWCTRRRDRAPRSPGCPPPRHVSTTSSTVSSRSAASSAPRTASQDRAARRWSAETASQPSAASTYRCAGSSPT